MLVDSMTALIMLQHLDPGAPRGIAVEEAMLATAFQLVRLAVDLVICDSMNPYLLEPNIINHLSPTCSYVRIFILFWYL